MARKALVILIFAALVAQGAFAQNFLTMPKNTITVDVAPMFLGLAINSLGNSMADEGLRSSGFGFAAQYERQLLRRLSMAARFAYLGIDLGYTEYDGFNYSTDMNLSSFSLEGHVRYYPFGEAFFLNGMLGYANFSSDFFGQARVNNITQNVNFSASGNYFKLGAKMGWRISLGRRGGFTIEPSFGYYHGVGLGDSVGQQFSDYLDGDSDVKDFFDVIEKYIFVGGPRFALNFGWRF